MAVRHWRRGETGAPNGGNRPAHQLDSSLVCVGSAMGGCCSRVDAEGSVIVNRPAWALAAFRRCYKRCRWHEQREGDSQGPKEGPRAKEVGGPGSLDSSLAAHSCARLDGSNAAAGLLKPLGLAA